MGTLTQEENDVLQKIRRAEDNCKDWHEQIKKRRKLYNFDHYDKEPKAGENRYIDPTYTNTVDLTIGILLGNEMKWHAVNWKPDVAGQIEADKIEKFLNGVIEINNFREEYDIPYEVYKHFTRDGAGVLYSPWDGRLAARALTLIDEIDEEADESVKQTLVYDEPPILCQVIDPLKMFLLSGGNRRWNMQVCADEMSVYDVEHKFGVSLEPYAGLSDEDKQAQKGLLKDYWELSSVKTSKKLPGIKNKLEYDEPVVKHAVIFEEEFIKPLKVATDYVDLPYTINFYQPGERDSSKEWGRSIIDALVPSVELLEKSINRRQHQIDVYSSLPILARTRGGKKLVFDPGMAQNVVNLDTDDEVSFPVWPGNSPDVAEQIDFVRARVQQTGFSDVMFGGGNNQDSGYALSQLSDQNRIRLEQPITHLEMLWAQWAKKILKLTETFAEDRKVRVYGRSRGQDFVDMVQGTGLSAFLVKCEIKPDFPNEKVRNHAMATQVKGILDDMTIMERYLGVEQPSDIQTKKVAQEALNNPIMMQYALLKQFRSLAETDPDAAMALKLLEAQLIPKEGQPTGSNPEQPVGTQSSTGQATPQAMGQEPPGQGEMANLNAQAGASPQMDGSI